jgi:peptidoglycan/LPS O-acetylase OafA/YrhL
MGLVRWSWLNDAPLVGSGWARRVVTIVLILAVAFLLDRLVVLPIDKLRSRFGAKRRIEPQAGFWMSARKRSTASL